VAYSRLVRPRLRRGFRTTATDEHGGDRRRTNVRAARQRSRISARVERGAMIMSRPNPMFVTDIGRYARPPRASGKSSPTFPRT